MTAAAPTTHDFQWSDLSKKPKEVGAAIDTYGEVTVTRGAERLRLAPDVPHPIMSAMRDLCRLLSALVESEEPDHVRLVLENAWPWTRALPSEDLMDLAREAGSVSEMCESLDTWSPLLDVLADWRRTARAWAEGARPVANDLGDGAVLSRPE